MRIQLLSDLHLEVNPHFMPQPVADADVLVLAGDIGAYQSRYQTKGSYFGLDRFANWPCPVVFVPGNHEYDMQDWDRAHQRLEKVCQRLGIIWLERRTADINGVRFIGTTLWTDYDAIAMQDSAVQAGDKEQLILLREKSYRAANFYLSKTGGRRNGRPFLADQVREQALECQSWLRSAIEQPFHGKRVVVTHFAPSLKSADPRYGMVAGTAGFCSSLDDLFPQVHLWLHGHLHTPIDYTEQGCRIVANPLGYAFKQEQGGFIPQACFDL